MINPMRPTWKSKNPSTEAIIFIMTILNGRLFCCLEGTEFVELSTDYRFKYNNGFIINCMPINGDSLGLYYGKFDDTNKGYAIPIEEIIIVQDYDIMTPTDICKDHYIPYVKDYALSYGGRMHKLGFKNKDHRAR